MEIPVYINQNEAGKLSVSQDGLYTLIEVEAPDSPGLVRLWAHGDGKSACLGVMQPWSGGLWLRRKLSALEMRSFPDPIVYVSDCAEEKVTENNLHNIKLTPEAKENEEKDSLHKEKQDREEMREKEDRKDKHNIDNIKQDTGKEYTQDGIHNEITDARACPWPAEAPEEGLLWYSRQDGSLVAFDGISSLIALPAGEHARLPRSAERMIEGKKYLVFRY